MQNFTIEELKTAIGHLMLDLRGSWGSNYKERILTLIELLERLIKLDSDKHRFDLNVARQELEDLYDGRIFRDSCSLYNYNSNEGSTQRVFDFLELHLEFPEYYQIKIN